MKEKVQDVRSRNVFLGIVFIRSMEYWVCLCCKSRWKVVSKEAKWSYEKVEMAVCVVGRARDCVRRSLAKVMLLLEEMNFGFTVSFVRLVEKCALSTLRWPRGEMRVRCRERK